MKKMVALCFALLVVIGCAQPIHAAETVDVPAQHTVIPMGTTPKLTIPKLPAIPKLTIKLDLNIDFSKYIPKI